MSYIFAFRNQIFTKWSQIGKFKKNYWHLKDLLKIEIFLLKGLEGEISKNSPSLGRDARYQKTVCRCCSFDVGMPRLKFEVSVSEQDFKTPCLLDNSNG